MKLRLTTFLLFTGALGLLACAKTNQASTPAKAQAASPTQASGTSAKPSAAASTTGNPVGGIAVVEAVSCRSVENRLPVGEGASFPTDVGRVYLFTKVAMEDASEGSIKHVWHYDGKEVGTVTLPVKGPQWRTYSSKQVDATSKGSWKVDITTASNELIKTVDFKIE